MKKPLVPGQSPADRRKATNTAAAVRKQSAQNAAKAKYYAEKERLGAVKKQAAQAAGKVAGYVEKGRKSAASKQGAQSAAKAAGMQKRSGVHVVKAGDSLWAIAQANNTTVAKLRALNPGAANGLFTGTKIRVRPSAAATSTAKALKKQGAQAAAKAAGMKVKQRGRGTDR